MESKKKNYLIYRKQSPLAFNKRVMICIKLSKTVLKAKDIIIQNFTLKRKHDRAFDKAFEKKKRPVEKNTITLDVKTRNWKCLKCGIILDRDVNSAINILNLWFNRYSLKNT